MAIKIKRPGQTREVGRCDGDKAPRAKARGGATGWCHHHPVILGVSHSSPRNGRVLCGSETMVTKQMNRFVLLKQLGVGLRVYLECL